MNKRTRQEVEDKLRKVISDGINELNEITGMSVSDIEIVLLDTNQITHKKCEYFLDRIRITYE